MRREDVWYPADVLEWHESSRKNFYGRKPVTLEQRLENWGRTVRSPRFQSSVCASWARWYIGIRGFVPDDQDLNGVPPAVVSNAELDAWMVEKCWQAIVDTEAKWLLKYRYVWRLSDSEIKIKMRKTHLISFRGVRYAIAMEQAIGAISRELVKIEARHILPVARKLREVEELCL